MTFEALAAQENNTRYRSLASTILPRLTDIRKASVKESLSGMTRIDHRLEYVATIQGIEFINDSRSTTINSTWFALSSYHKPIIWITGGVENGNKFIELMPVVRENVKAIVCLGKDNKKIFKTFGRLGLPIAETTSMEEAVWHSYQLANPGDLVLLSPACASFDLFENLEERGKAFRSAVKYL